ncbi:MAG TPA: Flp pilus assembly protein CpaB [Dehalococcoidia bacterium]|nr:Flp pilus assembly protein CpaB [Dehalococcoidia bacterium]
MATAAGQQTQGDKRPIIFAAVLGLIAAVLAVLVLNGTDGDGSSSVPAVVNVAAVVAAQDIVEGEEITSEMVEVRQIPETAAVASVFTTVNEVVGKRARFGLATGEQVTPTRLIETTPVRALSFQLPKGTRGFSIPVSAESSPSAVLVPGDFVDVLLTVDSELVPVVVPVLDPSTLTPTGQSALQAVAEGDMVVGTLFQNVQVVSVGETFVDTGDEYKPDTRGAAPEGGGAGFVVVAVSPEQAQVLTLARELGTLSFTLRPFGDQEFVPIAPFQEPFLIPLTAPESEPATE